MFGLFGKNSNETKALRNQIDTLKDENAKLSAELKKYKTFYNSVMESADVLKGMAQKQLEEVVTVPVVEKGEDDTFKQDHRKLKDAII